MRIALPCVGHAPMNVEKNLELIEKNLAHADLAVFPEMFVTGYSLKNRVLRFAEPLDGPIVKKLSEIATEHETAIVTGMPEFCPETNLVYNSAVVVMPDGNVKLHRKRKLATFGPFEEALFISPGREEHSIIEVNGFRIGLIICYELFFPEIAKAYAMKGADILICISASPSTTKKFFEAVLPARAIENTVFVCYSNLLGTEQNLVFWGGQRAYGPRGELLGMVQPYTEGILEIEVERSKLRIARKLRPTIPDTRWFEMNDGK
ncbi:MAG: carbon-nitrogen hydrolase family protein [Thermoplasmata archaeon]|nr:carbon-nitrogen hydrolase family protein [Thermoplasmata archaeon]